MNTDHVDAYFEALSKRDSLRILPNLAHDVILFGPIFPEAIIGSDAVVEVLSGFLETIDSLNVNLRFASDQNVAVFFSFTCNGITVNGNEHLQVNDDGLIWRIEVAWRPLPYALSVQEVFAKQMGFEPIRLAPASAALE
jgi:hypothetical protein